MENIKNINGGVCAAKGFTAAGIHCGIRKNKEKKDLALIFSEKEAAAAAVYTMNTVKGAPVLVTRHNLKNPYARAVICNSGNANTCNKNGIEIAAEMCALTAEQLLIKPEEVIVASTGVIGQVLDIAPIKKSLPALKNALSENGGASAAQAIMTTDTRMKETAVEFELNGTKCRLGGIAKGSGMICPNMATLLVFITTDVDISPQMLQKALSSDVKKSFNMVSVDGDTSTNDMVSVLANGLAGNEKIISGGGDFKVFKKALATVTNYLCREIARDGEGATKLLECRVEGAAKTSDAEKIAKKIIGSSLVKSMMFGEDANCGRILCAIGYAYTDTPVNRIDVAFRSAGGSIKVCENGCGLEFPEEKAKEVLAENEIIIEINLNNGTKSAQAWGCDLTYEYVKINGDYRT